jgi:hypothetical protein
MKATGVLSAETLRWLERRHEVMHDYVVRKIEEMPTDTAEVLFHKIKDACEQENIAGHAGRHDDGGAGKTLMAVEMFVHGWYKKLPREWQVIRSRLDARKDPDWELYQKLKKKFEGSK